MVAVEGGAGAGGDVRDVLGGLGGGSFGGVGEGESAVQDETEFVDVTVYYHSLSATTSLNQTAEREVRTSIRIQPNPRVFNENIRESAMDVGYDSLTSICGTEYSDNWD